ncbi:hypothetical protein L1049_011383 [Liquidambar formosana]|uniref:MPN domain-containing protein n=1 Tax=Liquidambar formosana TaxID=63359 RepID=A0AAP0RR82_LIQFO
MVIVLGVQLFLVETVNLRIESELRLLGCLLCSLFARTRRIYTERERERAAVAAENGGKRADSVAVRAVVDELVSEGSSADVPDQAERVIGTLLGSILPDGTVDIRNSYAVPHNESSDQVALDIDYHHNMLISHQKVNPKEVIVGWYSTGFGVTGGSALIHEFYSREVPNPVHLTVDTGFKNGEASIKAFVSVSLSLSDRQLAAQFQEIPLDLRMVEAERVGFDILKSTTVDKLPNDLEGMEASMERLLALIDDVYKYVDNVVEGHVEPDNNIGRFISDTVASVPKLVATSF